MANNRRVLDLWFEMMRAELEELVHVPVTARATEEIPVTSSAYRSQLLFEGPVHGVMYVTASASSLVQLSQMVAGEPIDPQAAWTEEGLEVWQIWLTATSGKLATRLSEEIGESPKSACTILLQDTSAVDGMHSASGADTTASGAAIQEWLLQAGEVEFALSVSAQVRFPSDDVPSVGIEQPDPEMASPEPIETVPQANPSREPTAEAPLPEVPAVPLRRSSNGAACRQPVARRSSTGFAQGRRAAGARRRSLYRAAYASSDSTCCSISNWRPRCVLARWSCRCAKCWNWGPATCCRSIGMSASQSN